MKKKLLFKISEAGEIHLEVQGTSGTECEKMSQDFEKELGLKKSKIFKDTYYEKNLITNEKIFENE